ncbi:MAG: phage/plasmid primase, P4 family [Gemmataceae bacterium]
MAKSKAPASVWMAEQFLASHRLVTYQDDVYAYNPAAGLYERAERAWLGHVVTQFLAETLGSEAVGSDYVADVARSVRDLAFLPGDRQPPFWLNRSDPADVIVAANGVVDLAPLLSGGEPALRPHTPDLVSVAGVPYAYDPTADCPRWREFLSWMFAGNQGEVELVRQFTGWVFVARRLKLEKALWFCGPGGNGKSTAMRVLRCVIGDAATSAVGLDAFTGGDFRLWPLMNRLANFACDVDVRRKAGVAGLNSFISGDPFVVNRKFREQLVVEPTTTCFFASNTPPLLSDASDAWWRRLLLIMCDRRPTEAEVDPHLLDRLKSEAPGILNWALTAIPGLLARRRFDIPDSVRTNVAALQNQVSAARMFLAEKVETGNPDHDFIPRDQLMALFEGWCRDNGYREDDLSVVKEEVRRAFGAELTRLRRGGPTGRGRERVRGWAGVRWRADEELQPPRPLDDLFRSQREQHRKAEEQQQEEAIKRGRVIREQGELIGLLERQLDRLKKQHVVDTTPSDVGEMTTPAITALMPAPLETEAPSARLPLIKSDDPQAAAELDALLARLELDDEPDRPAEVAR